MSEDDEKTKAWTETFEAQLATIKSLETELAQRNVDLAAAHDVIRRLQDDNREMPSIREYLKSLVALHSACGQLVEGIYKVIESPAHPLRKHAQTVEKSLKALAQK